MADAVDTSDLSSFADELRAIPDRQTPQIIAAVTHRTNRTAVKSRARAPKERPWLATEEGITASVGVYSGHTAVGTVRSGADPEGKFVGFHREFGTSEIPPQPFMVPAHREESRLLISDIGRIVAQDL